MTHPTLTTRGLAFRTVRPLARPVAGPRCGVCRDPIEGPAVRDAGNQAFHPGCLGLRRDAK